MILRLLRLRLLVGRREGSPPPRRRADVPRRARGPNWRPLSGKAPERPFPVRAQWPGGR